MRINKMAYVFFTSDCHWSHHNIISYCKRPFTDINHMLQSLVARWNERVSPEDTVCHLGDWCFTGKSGTGTKAHEYEDMLNGKIIHIRGNHDKSNTLRFALDVATVRLGGLNVLLQHRPPHNGSEVPKGIDLVLCGHVHGAFKHAWVHTRNKDILIINVGIDVWNYAPVRADEVLGYHSSVLKRENSVSDRVYINSFYEQKLI